MQVDANGASISIIMAHRDLVIQQLYYEQFLALKKLMELHLDDDWIWERHTEADGRTVSRIYKELLGVALYRKDNWGTLISFFKKRMVALDAFWSEAKYAFENLQL